MCLRRSRALEKPTITNEINNQRTKRDESVTETEENGIEANEK